MGSALSSAPTQVLGIETCLSDVDDGQHEFDVSLRSTRFLKTARTKFLSTMKVAKVFVKPDPSMNLQPFTKEIDRIQHALENNCNVQPFRSRFENDRVGVLIRQYFFSNLYDRLSTKPLLNADEKRWIVFQLLHALENCHQNDVCHGDVKIDNVLLTSWNWVFLADFASFKPTYIPVDNPAAFSYFFDTSGRRACGIAPERFYHPDKSDTSDGHICRFDGHLLPQMDIFSLGCVIYELMTDGKVLFTLPDLLSYRQGKFDIEEPLKLVANSSVRGLIQHMVSVDSTKRCSAAEYLTQYKGTVFPTVFYDFLHRYLLAFVGGAPMSPDQKIMKLDQDFYSICKAFKEGGGDEAEQKQLFVIIGSMVVACVRSLTITSAKLTAVRLLENLAARVPDDCTLDRILPHVNALIGDHVVVVRVAALRALTNIMQHIRVVRARDLNLFSLYILPSIAPLKQQDQPVLVRVAYAENLALLAASAQRILELAQLATMALHPAAPNAKSLDVASFDVEVGAIRDSIQEEVVTVMTDPSTFVKQALLCSNVSKLCAFLGPRRTSDVLLSHMLTYFNNNGGDWRLRAACFDSIVGVATYCGSKSLELYILPLMEKCLHDHEEFVIKHAIDAITASVELRLLNRASMLSLAADICPMLQHPNVWLQYAAVAMVCAVARSVSAVDKHTALEPMLRPVVTRTPALLHDEAVLLNVVKPCLHRDVYDFILNCDTIDAIYDCLLLRKLHREDPGSKDKRPRPAEETKLQNDLFGRLVQLGLTLDAEEVVLRFESFIKKVWSDKRAARESEPEPKTRAVDRGYLHVSTRSINAPVQEFSNGRKKSPSPLPSRRNRAGTVAANAPSEGNPALGTTPPGNAGGGVPAATGAPEKSTGRKGKANNNAASNNGSVAGAATGGSSTTSGGSVNGGREARRTVKNSMTELETPAVYIEPDVVVLAAKHAQAKKDSAGAGSTAPAAAGMKRKKARAAAEARERDTLALRTWRPEGKMVGHLQEHRLAVNGIAVSGDQSFFATCSDDGSVRVWDCSRLEGRSITNQSRLQFSPQQGSGIKHVAFCEANQSIVSASDRGRIHITRVEFVSSKFTPLMEQALDPTLDGVVVSLHTAGAAGNMVVYSTSRSRIHGWDMRMNQEAWCMQCPPTQGLISSTVVDPGLNWLMCGTSRGVYSVCDMRFQLLVKSWVDPRQCSVGALAMYPTCLRSEAADLRDGNWDRSSWVLAAGGDNAVNVWDVKTSQMVSLFSGTPSPQEYDQGVLQSSLDTVNAKNSAQIGAIVPPRPAQQLYEDDKGARSSAGRDTGRGKGWAQESLNEKARYFIKEKRDVIRYDDAMTASLQKRWTGPPLKHHTPGIRSIHTTPRNSAAFLGGSDGQIRVWDLDNPRSSFILGESKPQPGNSSRVDFPTTFDVDIQGKVQVVKETLGHETRKRLEPNAVTSRGPVAAMNHHANGVTALATVTQPDRNSERNKYLISASRDGVVKVWR
eukprot:m.1478883 g.1478883  ORF g.1478883 m.1478883 type:complete len:1480 (+) comp25166_c0_seq2:165-4604(+)